MTPDRAQEWTIKTVLELPGAPLARRRLHPEKSGVYFILEGRELVYIGSSTNMLLRLDQHRSSRKWKAEAEVKWLLYSRHLEYDMRESEHELIYCLRPRFNVVMNPDSDTPRSWTRNPKSLWAKRLIRRMGIR